MVIFYLDKDKSIFTKFKTISSSSKAQSKQEFAVIAKIDCKNPIYYC